MDKTASQESLSSASAPATDSTGWVERVREQVRSIAGDWVDEAAASWDRHAISPLVRITIHGPYDAGKSSLLKRLLVDDGTPVPTWLAVGAKPTSFDLDQVDSCGLTWVDTPGTAAGKDRHQLLAEQALTLTDALVVVLPPQLLSGDTGYVTELIAGTYYNPVARLPLFPPGALIIVVAQMDTAGVTAEDDLDGYRELLERKRTELLAVLKRDASVVPMVAIHLVAADPDQAGVTAQPTSIDYAGREDWDGVAALRRDLQALPGRLEELRAATALRYWSWIGGQARARAEDERQRLTNILDEAGRETEMIQLLQQELQAIDEAARSRLRERIHSELTTAVGQAGGADRLRTHLIQQLDTTISTWLDEWGGKLDQLAHRAATEHRIRAERPGAASLYNYLDELVVPDLTESEARTAPLAQRLLTRFDVHARTVARAGYKMLQGRSVDEARVELERLGRLSGKQLEQYFKNQEGFLTSAKQADQVRDGLRKLEAFEELLPIMLEIGAFFTQDYHERRAEQRRAELRAQLRRQADQIAEHVLEGGPGVQAWSDAVNSLRASLDAAQASNDVLEQTKQRRNIVSVAAATLTELLARPPRAWAEGPR
jgi:hypothetical protein